MARQKPRGDNHAARRNRRKRDKPRGIDRIPEDQRFEKPLPCAECGEQNAELVTGKRIYPHRPDLHGQGFWLCACGAYCGCHKGTSFPLGSTAGPLTRKARNAAHAAFDPLWKAKATRDNLPNHVARGAAYLWLAAQLGIEMKDCHISHMNAAQALRVVEVCEQGRADARAAAAQRAKSAADAYQSQQNSSAGAAPATEEHTA